MFKKIFSFFKGKESNIFQPKDSQTKLIASRSKIPFYRKLTKELIMTSPDEDLDKLIAYNIFAILQENKKLGDVCVNPKLSAGQRAFYITRVAEGEIINGGFNQFFFNYPDLTLPKSSVSDFDKINAKEFSKLISEALSLHTDPSQENQFKNRTLENLSGAYDNNIFTSLENRFSKINRENILQTRSKLEELRLYFAKENITQFT
jgi:hypothetical protein